ncbi:MAG: pyridoxamine 5'-phosphate oxidase family protein [Acidimicrobiales bacterium]
MSETALEVLGEAECLSLLEQVHYGRVAVVTAASRPAIFPVNFAVHKRTVVFLTGSTLLLARAPLGPVAFEADVIDPVTHEGWDVVVNGEGADITRSLDTRSVLARRQPIEHWVPDRDEAWIAIINPRFEGRRLYVPAPDPVFF